MSDADKPLALSLAELHLLLLAGCYVMTGILAVLWTAPVGVTETYTIRWFGAVSGALIPLVLLVVAPIMSFRRMWGGRVALFVVQTLVTLGGVLLALVVVVAAWSEAQQHRDAFLFPFVAGSWIVGAVPLVVSAPGFFFVPYLVLSKRVGAWFEG